jgi:Zn-dependent peptidase ImmA (M78 family)
MLGGKPGSRKWKSAAARRLLALASTGTIPHAVNVVVNRLLEGVPCPPTNLEQLGVRLNVRRIRFEDLPVAGALVRLDDGFEILCSSSAGSGRQQFTIAHEIAHAIFESTGPRCPQGGDELERLCDMLATEILMPRSFFLEMCDPVISISNLYRLARSFKTSLSATAIRSAELRGVSVFEADARKVLWGYGIVKKGALTSIDSGLTTSLEWASNGHAGQDEVYLNTAAGIRKWRVEHKPIAQGRSLFLLQRASATREA